MSYFTSNPIMILNYPEGTEAAIIRISDNINKIIHKDGSVYIKDYSRFNNISDTDDSASDLEVSDDDVSHEGMDYDMAPGDRRKDLDLNAQELDEMLKKQKMKNLSEKLKAKLMQI